MVTSAPEIPLSLLRVIARESRAGVVYADVWRAVGAAADARGLTRPSYQRVRVLAHEAIARRARRQAVTLIVVVLHEPPVRCRARTALRTLVARVAAASRSAGACVAKPRK